MILFCLIRPFEIHLFGDKTAAVSLSPNKAWPVCQSRPLFGYVSIYPSRMLFIKWCHCYLAILQDVELSLNAFQLEDCIECSCDFLSIYDGSNDTGPLLHNLCGGNLDILPLMVVSSSKMFIRFKTDGSTTGNLVGFSSRVQFLDGGKSWTYMCYNQIICIFSGNLC